VQRGQRPESHAELDPPRGAGPRTRNIKKKTGQQPPGAIGGADPRANWGRAARPKPAAGRVPSGTGGEGCIVVGVIAPLIPDRQLPLSPVCAQFESTTSGKPLMIDFRVI